MKYTYKTRGVCAVKIEFDLDGDVVRNIRFLGGCDGNLKAISKRTTQKDDTIHSGSSAH